MNYLRGAVSAISAPYQYYKDLAPLNPSTLTGAIDVIVVRIPTEDGNLELHCSPFHVRFGKWQVLRPGDKKVNVSVNGHPIPFYMKIGEAGEAFFVFETEAEVPEDLITSPLLEATRPGTTSPSAGLQGGRFGSKEDGPTGADPDAAGAAQEPEYFDLDASAPSAAGSAVPTEPSTPTGEHPSGPTLGLVAEAVRPANLLSAAAGAGKAVAEAVKETAQEKEDRLLDHVDAAQNMARSLRGAQGADGTDGRDHGDEALPQIDDAATKPSELSFTGDVVIDFAGYHERDASGQTATPESDTVGTPQTEPTSTSPRTPDEEQDQATPHIPHKSIPFPAMAMRATSEPPPDLSGDLSPALSPPTPPARARRQHTAGPSGGSANGSGPSRLSTVGPNGLSLALPEEEYMWEWGAFPQRSPLVEKFETRPLALWNSPGTGRGKARAAVGGTPTRSRSLPLEELEEQERTSALRDGGDEGDADGDGDEEETEDGDAGRRRPESGTDGVLGAGGRLIVDKSDRTRMGVWLDGVTLWFELAVIPASAMEAAGPDARRRGVLGGLEEVEASAAFEQRKLTFERFLDDETLIGQEGLVMKWANDRFITRSDGSPLMDALGTWRDNALRERAAGAPSRPQSPLPEDAERRRILEEDEPLSSSDERDPGLAQAGLKPSPPRPSRTNSSWSRWWRGSQKEEQDARSAAAASGAGAARSESLPAVSTGVTPPANGERDAASARPAVPFPSSASASPSLRPTQADGKDASNQEQKKFVKTLRLTSDQLKALDLKVGANSITFSLSASGAAACTARIFVWEATDSIVISDIDGTITKSDALGHVFTMIGRDWTHLGVAKLYTDICRNGYKIMYLTSRAIGQADSTRDYLKGIKQNDYQLPEGPVIMSPDRLMASLHREVIMRKPEVFKMACLRDIRRLFGAAGNPFYAGFGNRITDALSYRSVDVPSSRIFTIDSTGDVKMELLELAGYKSSYIHMTDLVDQMFPPIHRKWVAEFTDSSYWKPPMGEYALPDLTPPSPALSARSDTSNQSTLARLRNFSLVTSSKPKPANARALPLPVTESGRRDGTGAGGLNGQGKSSHLRQMSSFERLGQTLGLGAGAGSRSSESPFSSSTYLDSGSGSEDEGEEGDVDWQQKQKRVRRRSMESMPGSLPGSEEDMELGEEEEYLEEGYGHDGGGDEGEGEGDDEQEDDAELDDHEGAFDDDLLAAGEMAGVPFL